MKKSKLIISITTLCLAIAVLCFGVYAVQTVNYSLSGNITYEVTDAFVEVQTKLYKSTSYLTSGQLGLKVNEIAESNFATIPEGLTLVDTSAKTNSTSGTLDPYSKTDLSFSTQAGSECYAYFFVTNIKNMSTEKNVWAVMQDDLTNPTNTVQINNGLQQTIKPNVDPNGKNMVIGVGLDNPGNPIPSGTSSEFSYGIKIGVGDLATQDFNLAKLTFPTGTVAAADNRERDTKGVVVIPDKNPTTKEAITTIKGNYYPGGSFTNSNFTTIVMPDTINNIDLGFAFAYNKKLTKIVLSQSLKSIGDNSFVGCSKLTSIVIPSSVTSIGDNPFGECSELESIKIEAGNTAYTSRDKNGNEVDCLIEISTNKLMNGCKNSIIPSDGSVTSIENSAFNNCKSLSSITIPNSVTGIGRLAFSYCTNLTSITIPNSVTSIGDGAFSGCTSLTSIEIPSSVTNIVQSIFSGCTRLNSITIPSSVTSIGNEAFKGCLELATIEIPSSVTSIGNCAFEGCTGLTSIVIPNSVTKIGSSSFSQCSGLEKILVETGNTAYTSRDKNGNEVDCLIEIPTNKLMNGCKNSVIPSDGSVTSIDSEAFRGCTGLTEITIPDSVTSIGGHAFNGCKKITTITIPSSVATMGVSVFFDWIPTQKIYVPFSEGNEPSGWNSNWKNYCGANIQYLAA